MENADLYNRFLDIRQLVEDIRPKALRNILDSKEKQKRQQNRNQNVKFEELIKGTQVLLIRGGINPKLSSIYQGPYTIVSRNNKNNYILNDITGQRVLDEFPLSKLKVVEKFITTNASFEVKKILDSRQFDGINQYLVKWNDDNAEDSWVNEKDFNSKDIIHKYLEKKNFLKIQNIKKLIKRMIKNLSGSIRKEIRKLR